MNDSIRPIGGCNMSVRTEIVKALLPGGKWIHVATNMPDGMTPGDLKDPSFSGVTNAIEGIADSVTQALKKVEPQHATVAFNVEVSIEAGELTALIAKGSGTASITVTLEWAQNPPS